MATELTSKRSTLESSELIKLLYTQASVGFIASVVNSSVLVFILWEQILHTILIYWLICILLISIIRYIITLRYRSATLTSNKTNYWANWFIYGIALPGGIIWGSAGIVLFPSESIAHQVFLVFVLGGTSMGAVVVYSSLIKAFIVFIIPNMFPIAIRFFIAGDEIHLAMGGMSIFLCIVLIFVAKRLHIITLTSLKLRFENKDLIHSLITEKNETEKLNEKLQKSADKLHELNASKDKFFSIISHDLRNPFNALIGFSDLCINKFETLSKEKLKYLMVKVNTSAKNLHQLVEDMFSWSQVLTNRVEFLPTQIELSGLVNRCFDLQKVSAIDKSINMISNITENTFVYVDRNMIFSVLLNLISNAIKFTNNNGQLTISSQDNGQFLELSVSDTGVGVSENDLHKLLSIDFRYTTNGTANEKGSGLGLILCKELIEKNGGSIWIESVLDKGTTIKFTLLKNFKESD